MALIARDGGCSFPGCTHPPSWCDRHHILDWILGGIALALLFLKVPADQPEAGRRLAPARGRVGRAELGEGRA